MPTCLLCIHRLPAREEKIQEKVSAFGVFPVGSERAKRSFTILKKESV